MLWYINSRMYQPHPLDHSVLMFFTWLLMQFVPLTYLNTLISNTRSVILHSQENVFTLLQHMMSSFRVVSQHLGLYYAVLLFFFSFFLPFVVGSRVTMLAESVAQGDG